ncbi:MAG: DUF423 domain-containing protein [Candidatus Hydrogenedentes bacterium]|nr:DUF423 domain-containing protein [Candidatus Hydrogenedentota bacterium]
MRNTWVAIAGTLGGLGVALGAFGAHGLKERLTPELLAVFEVGVRYHMYHAIAILAVALALKHAGDNAWFKRACWCWLAGVAIFSGSLYLLAVTDTRWLGAITPFGGVAFIAGWCCIAVEGLRRTNA